MTHKPDDLSRTVEPLWRLGVGESWGLVSALDDGGVGRHFLWRPLPLDPAALEARDRELDATGRLTRTGAPGSKTWGRTSRGGQVGVPRWRQVNEKLGGRIAGHVELDTERQRGSRCPLGSDRVSKETTETKPRDALRLGRSIVGAPTDMPCFLG